jgi:hypothetical protein
LRGRWEEALELEESVFGGETLVFVQLLALAQVGVAFEVADFTVVFDLHGEKADRLGLLVNFATEFLVFGLEAGDILRE